MMKNKRYWIIGIAIVILIMLIIACLRCCNSSLPVDNLNSNSTETEETTSGTLDFIPADDDSKRTITLPVVSGLNVRAGQLKQLVDINNPNKNCYFIVSIYLSDGTMIYKSDLIAPLEKLTEITLTQTLQKGVYRNCSMVFECYALDKKTALNGGRAKIEINTQ